MRYCEYFYKQIYCYLIDKQFLFETLKSVLKVQYFHFACMCAAFQTEYVSHHYVHLSFSFFFMDF